jgi:hypothetical protein
MVLPIVWSCELQSRAGPSCRGQPDGRLLVSSEYSGLLYLHFHIDAHFYFGGAGRVRAMQLARFLFIVVAVVLLLRLTSLLGTYHNWLQLVTTSCG